MAYLLDRQTLETEAGIKHITENMDNLSSDIFANYCCTNNTTDS